MKLLSLLFLPFVNAVIKGINIYGLETPRRDFVCSWQHSVSWYVDKLSDLGFNSLRIPISLEYVMEGKYYKLQELFDAVQKHPSMTVILDMHRIFSDHQAYSPEEKWVSLDIFIDNWKKILYRFKDNPQLQGVDYFNEYQGTDSNYWNSVSSKIIKELEDEFPERFIYYVGGTNWGGNLHDMNVENFEFSDRVRYTIHKYHFSGKDERDWDYSFGAFPYKVMVGEWGFKTQVQHEKEWAIRFTDYLIKRNIRDTYFWTIAHSGDTDGLWYDDCENINFEKLSIIQKLWG